METGSVTADQNRQISRSAAWRRQFEYQTVISSTEQQSANLLRGIGWNPASSSEEGRVFHVGLIRGLEPAISIPAQGNLLRGSRDYFITSPSHEKKILHLVFWGNQRSMLVQTLPVIMTHTVPRLVPLVIMYK